MSDEHKDFGKTEERFVAGGWHTTVERATLKYLGLTEDEFKTKARDLAAIMMIQEHATSCTITYTRSAGAVVTAEIVLTLPLPALLELVSKETELVTAD